MLAMIAFVVTLHNTTYLLAQRGKLSATQPSSATASQRGHLVIIGGGSRPEPVMKKFIELAGGASSRIIIMPMASGEPDEVAAAQRRQLEAFGAGKVDVINCTAQTADADTNIALLRTATGVFFSGGDQNKLKRSLWGTRLLDEIHTLYARRRGVIGGTSAGAAIQSRIMLTGEERVHKDSSDNPFGAILRGNVGIDTGFGFVNKIIVDQHFIKRKRHNRLLTLVLEHPALPGVGIDESTCIIVNPDDTFDVMGEATVMVIDASKARGITTDNNSNLAAHGIVLHILPNGARYDMRRKRVIAW
jgi:cyanophycinase